MGSVDPVYERVACAALEANVLQAYGVGLACFVGGGDVYLAAEGAAGGGNVTHYAPFSGSASELEVGPVVGGVFFWGYGRGKRWP